VRVVRAVDPGDAVKDLPLLLSTLESVRYSLTAGSTLEEPVREAAAAFYEQALRATAGRSAAGPASIRTYSEKLRAGVRLAIGAKASPSGYSVNYVAETAQAEADRNPARFGFTKVPSLAVFRDEVKRIRAEQKSHDVSEPKRNAA
jgi:hypothetical protein